MAINANNNLVFIVGDYLIQLNKSKNTRYQKNTANILLKATKKSHPNGGFILLLV
jgi:hypothetical protein